MHDEATLEQLGFMLHRGGVHAARTIMLDELTALFEIVPADAEWAVHSHAIRDDNCLAKRSGGTRALTARHLRALYSLSPANPIYAGLRYFWARDASARPQLALLAACARDPLLREIAPFILKATPGTQVSREQSEAVIATLWPGRFSAATLKSTAQNVNSSLTKSCHLQGRVKKQRRQLEPAIGAVAYALYLGWLRGERGELLLQNEFCKLLDALSGRLLEIAAQASARGWMVLRRIDNVVDVDFPALASPVTTFAQNWDKPRDVAL